MIFSPHGFCLNWNPLLVGLDILTNALIALSYYAIPITLVALFGRQYNSLLRWFGVAFAVFIFACGTTHVMDIVVLYKPLYWLQMLVQGITAAASVYVAVALILASPVILTAMRDPAYRHRLKGLQEQLSAILKEVQQKEVQQRTDNTDV